MGRRKKRKPLKLVTVPKERTNEDFADSAATRQRIADEQAEMLAEAVRVCGPGATAYGRWEVKDRLGLEPDRIIYCCRRPEFVGWQPGPTSPAATTATRIRSPASTASRLIDSAGRTGSGRSTCTNRRRPKS